MASITYSSSSTASDPSPPPSPRARMAFPSLAFAGAMTIPLKSPPSPPSTTVSPSDFSIKSPSRSMSPVSTAAYASCAFPSWPKSDILSPTASLTCSPASSSPYLGGAYTGCQASSYITDEDLLDLATLPLYNNIRIPPELLIAATPAHEVVFSEKRRPRSRRVILPEAVQLQSSLLEVSAEPSTTSLKRRRRSSPLKRRKLVLGLSPVVEDAE